MEDSEVVAIVTEFTGEYLQRHLIWQIGQIIPGADGWIQEKLPPEVYAGDLRYMMQPQEWMTMARYGVGLISVDSGEIHDICQAMAEWLFAFPGSNSYSIPNEWADSAMGALWWMAYIRATGDELITIVQAAELAGVSQQAITARIDRGSLRAFTDPGAKQRQGRRLVRKGDILADRRN